MKVVIYLLIMTTIIVITGCNAGMESAPQDVEFSNLHPTNGTTDIPTIIFLYWSSDFADSLDLFYGVDPENLDKEILGLPTPDCYIENLSLSTTYYWKVVGYNIAETKFEGPLMSFSTRDPDWQEFFPTDGLFDLPLNVYFSWNISRDVADSVSYDFLMGTEPDFMEILEEGLSEPYFQVDSLLYGITYFWQVIAHYQSEQILESEIFAFSTRDRFIGFQPQDEELNIAADPLLSWECDDAVTFDVYLGTESADLNLMAGTISENSYQLYNLQYETIYYWQVKAYLSDGNTWTGPELLFITTIDPIPPGYKLNSYLMRAELPCNIDVVYRVTDMGGKSTTEFTDEDFTFLEDEELIDPVESLLEISSGNELNSTNRTVLMIDNSTSMDSLLGEIKLAANDFVDNLLPNQEVAIYTFSEYPVLIEDFTKNNTDLISAINSIESGYASTDLYGAFIVGVEHWVDFYYPENLVKGNLILITDGSDTQGSTSLQEALDARGEHLVYTIGIGSHVDTYALNQLANEKFFHIPSAGHASETFTLIQDEITAYLNSFYWLHYITPKRGDFDHTIEVSLNDNHNIGSEAVISDEFNSLNFFGTLPGVFVNVDPEAGLPYGIEEYTIADSISHKLTATSYNYDFEPVYTWQIDNPAIATLTLQGNNGSFVLINAGGITGTTELTVTDTANNHMRRIEVTSEVEYIFQR